ncbi:cytochrome p450 704b1 [Quercus suber]|uniref:Cytochrome p450 704b1 n=1 Tax=Quercus suber TaxID=58331 RepID=A0AAW0LLF0_QUESU
MGEATPIIAIVITVVITALISPISPSLSLSFGDLLMRMTLDSICKVRFGVEIGTLGPNLPDNHFAQAFDNANIIVTLRFIDPLWKNKETSDRGQRSFT